MRQPTIVDLQAIRERAGRELARSIIGIFPGSPKGTRAAIDRDRALIRDADDLVKRGDSLAAYELLMNRYGEVA